MIIGIEGFIGSYLSRYLLSINENVIGTYHHSLGGLQKKITKKIETFKLDILNKNRLEKILDKVKPDYIYLLAAQSSNLESFKNPQGTLSTNVGGLMSLLEAIRVISLNPKILLAGSSEEYGRIEKQDLPLKEDHPCRPENPYAFSKLTGESLADYYAQNHQLKIVKARFFTQEGAGKSEKMAISSFCKQIALIEKGIQNPVIEVGDLSPIRDFTDIRDGVGAYYLLAKLGKEGQVYNICSGKGYKIKEILNKVIANYSASDKIEVRVKGDLKRKSQNPVIIGSFSRVYQDTGWKPQIPIDETIAGMISFWRERV